MYTVISAKDELTLEYHFTWIHTTRQSIKVCNTQRRTIYTHFIIIKIKFRGNTQTQLSKNWKQRAHEAQQEQEEIQINNIL